MIKRLVLWGLSEGVSAGDLAAARAAVGRVDWLVRGVVRRRLEWAVVGAVRETGEAREGDAEQVRHVLKTAALAVAGSFYNPLDRVSVEVEYDALPRLVAPRLWLATIGAVMFVMAAVAAIVVVVIASQPPQPVQIAPRPLPPPSARALLDGGQPMVDPAMANLLGRALPELIVEADRDHRSGEHRDQRLQHAEKLAASPVIAAHGAALVEAWQAMLSALDRWVDLPSEGEAYERGRIELLVAVQELNDALIAAGIGYYVDGAVAAGAADMHAIVSSYRIDEVSFVRANGVPRRVLALRRLDGLNYTRRLLALEAAQLGGAVLLLDKIDQYVATKVIVLFAPNAPYPLGDPDWAAEPVAQSVAAAAGEAIRRELSRVVGDDAGPARAIGQLLDERTQLMAIWRKQFARPGDRYEAEALMLPRSFLNALDGRVPAAQRQRALAIEDELIQRDAARLVARLSQVFADTARHHEVQHAVDDDASGGRRPAYPIQLARYIGRPVSTEVDPAQTAVHARAELSAYLSQIANDPVTPQLAYWHLASSAFDMDGWNTPESFAAVVASEALAEALHVPSERVIHDRKLDRDRLAAIGLAIAAQSDDALRAAAAASWRQLFGAEVPAMVDLPRR